MTSCLSSPRHHVPPSQKEALLLPVPTSGLPCSVPCLGALAFLLPLVWLTPPEPHLHPRLFSAAPPALVPPPCPFPSALVFICSYTLAVDLLLGPQKQRRGVSANGLSLQGAHGLSGRHGTLLPPGPDGQAKRLKQLLKTQPVTLPPSAIPAPFPDSLQTMLFTGIQGTRCSVPEEDPRSRRGGSPSAKYRSPLQVRGSPRLRAEAGSKKGRRGIREQKQRES